MQTIMVPIIFIFIHILVYLSFLGYSHAAFTLKNETNISDGKYNQYQIGPGMLILYLEKALLLMQMETHLNHVLFHNLYISLFLPMPITFIRMKN